MSDAEAKDTIDVMSKSMQNAALWANTKFLEMSKVEKEFRKSIKQYASGKMVYRDSLSSIIREYHGLAEDLEIAIARVKNDYVCMSIAIDVYEAMKNGKQD